MKNLDDPFDRMPSLLDRLIDDGTPEPGVCVNSTFRDCREINDSLLVDIEKLLNTRTRCVGVSDRFRELDVSLLDYGLRDFSSRDLASELDRTRLIEEVRSVVTRYEPRLRDVQVELMPRGPEFDREVRFRIVASVNQGRELLFWDAGYSPSNGTFTVKEEIP